MRPACETDLAFLLGHGRGLQVRDAGHGRMGTATVAR